MRIVNMLTRPTNMVKIITSLLGKLKFAVNPTLSPTVLYAEKHSKAMLNKSFSLSKDAMLKVAPPITTNDKEMIANALRTEMSAISRLYISIRFLPLAKLKKLSVAIAKVLVLIPPPVEPGEAPIHMSRKIIMMVGKLNNVISIALKPAVLGEVALKKDVTIFPKKLCGDKVLLYSNARNN